MSPISNHKSSALAGLLKTFSIQGSMQIIGLVFKVYLTRLLLPKGFWF